MLYQFKIIDLEKDIETCERFRRDSYIVSFGTHSGYEAEMSNYKERMTERISYLPHGNCHLWYQDKIIGQTEMKFADNPKVGYISLFYLVPEFRGRGLGELLHKHAVSVFTTCGKTSMQLSVSKTNLAAIAFYSKHGWSSLGKRPGKKHVILMNYALTNCA